MKSARYPKPKDRRVDETEGSASAEGGGNGWYSSSAAKAAEPFKGQAGGEGKVGTNNSGGGGNGRSGAEYCLHSDLTILVIREM